MFWGRGILFLFIVFYSFLGHSAETPLFINFLQEPLFNSLALENKNDLLNTIKQQNPELQIIVLDQTSGFFSDKNPITYLDSEISPEAQEFYEFRSKKMIQSVAYFIAPHAQLNNFSERPLQSLPVLVLKKNSPRHVVLHEFGHYYLNLYLRQNKVARPTNEALYVLVEGVAEEVYVDSLLLQYRDELSFDDDDLCARHRYLAQNLQVMNFKLKELLKNKELLSPSDQNDLSELYDIYGSANKIRLEHHVQCVFWRPSLG